MDYVINNFLVFLLTNIFHIAVHLFSDRSQRRQNVGRTHPLLSIGEQTHGNKEG